MLAIIDMQNHILDPAAEFYIPGIEEVIPRIAERIQQARDCNEYILYTQDIPIEYKDTAEEAAYGLQLIDALKPRSSDRVCKKYYFGIPPEAEVAIKKDLIGKEDHKKIEIVGVETSLCVLVNTLKLQSAFPEADMMIQSDLTTGRKHTKEALEILAGFNIDIQ